MPYDTTNYIYVHPKAHRQPAYLPHETKKDKTNEQTEMLRRNGPVIKSVEAGTEYRSMAGKIYECRFWARSEIVKGVMDIDGESGGLTVRRCSRSIIIIIIIVYYAEAAVQYIQ